jgi:16S rRNA (adenine1518-N6/adenine1519-N6)-dimethyltransferase
MRQPLGQHFLRDQNVVKAILAAAELAPSDTALEIGPGKGVLTEGLLSRVKRLVAVELDARLAQNLKTRFTHKPSLEIIHSDFLKVALDSLFSPADIPIKILGNLPYSITSPIFEKIMPWTAWETGVFLIQREVAARITAAPGSRAYGILTLAVQLFAEAETILQVQPGAFLPPPKVSSSVIRLRRKAQPLVAPERIPDFFDLVHGAFAHRRKTIANSLAFHAKISRSKAEKWLTDNGLRPQARAETVPLADYAKLCGAWSIFRREINLT